MATELQKLVEEEKIKVRQEAQRTLAEEHLETWNMAVEACREKVEIRKSNEYAVRHYGKYEARTWDEKHLANAVIEDILAALEELTKHEN